MSQKKVEIAGAGLAGLALGTRLAQLGWKVVLHERADDLRMFGSGIWLWDNGLKALKILGAYDKAVANARKIREWRIEDGNGGLLMSQILLGEGRDRLLLPPRADLYEALIERAGYYGVEVHTSSVATAVRKEGVLVMESGEERRADLVVVADGAYSRLRESLFATAWMDYGVEGGFRLLVDHREGDPTDVITEWWSGPWRVMFNPCTDGSDYVYLGGPVGEDRARVIPVEVDFWAEKFPAAGDLFTRVDTASRWDRIVNVRLREWSSGRVAIVGDAANAMPPNLGQSANMAFSNAMALAMAVDGCALDDIPGALREWEARQRPLTDHVQWWSYIYNLVLGKWPTSFMPLRSDLVRLVAGMEWFNAGLFRGARHTPAGYDTRD
ncbi:FAD-dependent monooxygenase [Zavarzinia compransoris]|uniref:FAD-dependent oxidoreductase n=1 Tax=Zavarzinia marina TaxID=2911065 RepID=UPI001F439F36|nr:NAD(P)/FAD-dependent oxidoreductase [Zavarzinia marina]MCF4167364.1 FAD-dependent monooxygenase [Zavarzinia marina]